MIGEDHNVPIDQITMPFTQSLHDGKHLALVNRLASLSGRQTLAVVTNRHIHTIMFLHQNPTNSNITCIHMDGGWLIKLRHLQHRRGSKRRAQRSKSLSLPLTPYKSGILLQ